MSLRPRTIMLAIGVVFVLAAPVYGGTEAGLVETTTGPVQGVRAGERWRFLGIPYAAAPVGERRWRRPEPAPTWSTPLLADAYGPACPQPAFVASCGTGGLVIGDEDCLTLNVWTPSLDGGPRSVMVYIHGGAFTSGCARLPAEGGLAASDVVLVSIEYRLHALGFFAIDELIGEDADASAGNYGLLDQLFALRWVQDNIAGFGGDPANVTIFGESAGGASVCALLASPLSAGLFRRGIVESGLCNAALPLQTTPGALPPARTAVGRGDAVAEAVDCRGPERLACLRQTSAVDLVLAPLPDGDRILDGLLDTVLPFPAIDGYVLNEQPLLELRAGIAAGQPVVTGSNDDELTVFVSPSQVPTEQAYTERVRAALGDELADAILPLYPVGDFGSPVDAYHHLATDMLFACPAQEIADAVTAGGSEAYLYQFTRVPDGPVCAAIGAYHTLELLYLFDALAVLTMPPLSCTPTAADSGLAAMLQQAWTSFATAGVPETTPAWPLFDPDQVDFFNLRVPFSVDAPLRAGRCAALLSVLRDFDPDGDDVLGDDDNCPQVANSAQQDANLDGVGDACEPTPTASATPVATDTATPVATDTPTPAASDTATAVATATETGTVVATPTVPPAECAADCAGNQVVTIDDLVAAVGIALGTLPHSRCASADIDRNGTVSIDELIRAVRAALTGCPAA
jgi:para-nitrobenzyl esterase